MHPRFLSLLLLLLLAPLTACSGGQPDEGQAQGPMELTHTWNVAPGTSLFVSADMGTKPAENGDAMMKVMPGVLHRIGEACKTGAGLEGDGEIVLTFNMAGGVAKAVTVDPEGQAADCLAEALAKEGEALGSAPDGTVMVRTSYAVTETLPPPPG